MTCWCQDALSKPMQQYVWRSSTLRPSVIARIMYAGLSDLHRGILNSISPILMGSHLWTVVWTCRWYPWVSRVVASTVFAKRCSAFWNMKHRWSRKDFNMIKSLNCASSYVHALVNQSNMPYWLIIKRTACCTVQNTDADRTLASLWMESKFRVDSRSSRDKSKAYQSKGLDVVETRNSPWE